MQKHGVRWWWFEIILPGIGFALSLAGIYMLLVMVAG